MSRAYLRYEPRDTFGVITSPSCNVSLSRDGKYIITGALEYVTVWEARTGKCAFRFSEPLEFGVGGSGSIRAADVTCVCVSPDGKHVAAGYSDGSVKVWDLLDSQQGRTAFRGHKRAVTALCYRADGSLLASGSQDTDVVVWDVVGERGLYRLRGHKGAVSSISFLSKSNYLCSCALDSHVKLWDLAAGPRCVQTIALTRAQASAMCIDRDERRLVVGGTDGFIRVWDIESLHDEQAAEKLRSAKQAAADEARRATDTKAHREHTSKSDSSSEANGSEKEEEMANNSFGPAMYIGALNRRSTRDRIGELHFSPDACWMAVVSSQERFVEVFQFFSAADAKFRMKRRKARRKKKLEKSAAAGELADDKAPVDEKTVSWIGTVATDEFVSCTLLGLKARVRSLAWAWFDADSAPHVRGSDSSIASAIPLSSTISGSRSDSTHRLGRTLALSLRDNRLGLFQLSLIAGTPMPASSATALDVELNRLRWIEHAGHRSEIRALALSSDDRALLSTSKQDVKLWDVNTMQCTRTMASEYGLCALFVPGNRHAIIGSKKGNLQIFDIDSAQLLETVEAHSGPVWSLSLLPDRLGFCSGGGDGLVKFWSFQVIEEQHSIVDDLNEQRAASSSGAEVVSKKQRKKAKTPTVTKKRLTIAAARAVEMTDQVLSVCVSQSKKHVAIALLDTTVRVLMADSLEFFASLYGHKLPVMAMDISDDGALIATGSSDKTLKIWGLDFGDCHRSLIAHEDSVMQVQFAPRTHYVFTAGKDGRIRQWDADRFDLIITLEGHHAEVWGLAINRSGTFLASCSADRSMRLWDRSEEPLFVEEEREVAMERVFESTLEEEDARLAQADDAEVGSASKRTLETIKSGEKLIEAIEFADNDMEIREQASRSGERLPEANPFMLGLTPEAFVLHTLRQIKPSELEEAMMVLPFASSVISLLKYMRQLLRDESAMAHDGAAIELIVRALHTLILAHQQQIMSSGAELRSLIADLYALSQRRLQECRSVIMFNVAALKVVQRQLQENTLTPEFAELLREKRSRGKKGIRNSDNVFLAGYQL